MENQKKSSYAIIPCYILDNDELEEGAKNLYARISMLSDEGRCWASNEYFAEKHKVTTRCIQNWLKELVDAGYIEIDVDKSGFQTRRDIWIINDFKKQFTKRTTVRVGTNHSSPPHEPQFASSIYTNNRDTNKTTTTANAGCSGGFSDSEKVKAMQSVKLSENVVDRALKFTLEEIKLAIECCLNEPKTIDNIDGYFMSALKEKWQPKPNKAKIQAIQEDNAKQQQQNRQKFYLEAKQLEITHKYNLKEPASFSVNENTIMLKINNGHCPYQLTDESLKILKKYIKDNHK